MRRKGDREGGEGEWAKKETEVWMSTKARKLSIGPFSLYILHVLPGDDTQVAYSIDYRIVVGSFTHHWISSTPSRFSSPSSVALSVRHVHTLSHSNRQRSTLTLLCYVLLTICYPRIITLIHVPSHHYCQPTSYSSAALIYQ